MIRSVSFWVHWDSHVELRLLSFEITLSGDAFLAFDLWIKHMTSTPSIGLSSMLYWSMPIGEPEIRATYNQLQRLYVRQQHRSSIEQQRVSSGVPQLYGCFWCSGPIWAKFTTLPKVTLEHYIAIQTRSSVLEGCLQDGLSEPESQVHIGKHVCKKYYYSK